MASTIEGENRSLVMSNGVQWSEYTAIYVHFVKLIDTFCALGAIE